MKINLLEVAERALIIPTLRIDKLEDAVPLAKALYAAGITVIEILLRTPQALAAIKEIKKACPDLIVGAGTIRTKEQMQNAIEAGAQFGVSPVSNKRLLMYAKEYNFPFMPGVETPTEIQKTANWKFPVLKLFPTDLIGKEEFIKNTITTIFSNVMFCCSSNTSQRDDLRYLQYKNVVAIAAGAWLVPSDLLVKQDWNGITNVAREALREAKLIRQNAVSLQQSNEPAKKFVILPPRSRL